MDSDLPAQTFNHVAMSVPAALLGAEGRASLLDFFGEVFGWTEMPTLTEDGHRLVLRAHSNEQFVFLIADDQPMRCPSGDHFELGRRTHREPEVIADDQPMRCPSGDHFGLSVRTPAELDAILERDPRVEIDEKTIEDHRVLQLHSFYVGYRLPLKIEVQCYAWADGVGPQSMPRR